MLSVPHALSFTAQPQGISSPNLTPCPAYHFRALLHSYSIDNDDEAPENPPSSTRLRGKEKAKTKNKPFRKRAQALAKCNSHRLAIASSAQLICLLSNRLERRQRLLAPTVRERRAHIIGHSSPRAELQFVNFAAPVGHHHNHIVSQPGSGSWQAGSCQKT